MIIPVRRYSPDLQRCLQAVISGTAVPEIVIMDCTGEPDALQEIRSGFPGVRIFDMGMNPGRAHAVNTGIHIAVTPYVMTLSPRILVGRHCIERMIEALKGDKNLLSVQARIMSAEDHGRISSAGWSLDAGAVPVVRGRGGRASSYMRRSQIMAAGMDAAMYRMEALEVTGIFDERFYARLEDLDLGYRGQLAGFGNLYEPEAVCREMESAETSSFYEQLETGNLVYLRYKHNLPEIGKIVGKLLNREDPEREAALQRGAMLCFQAEMEMMEREELGMSVTKLTLPDEFCMEVKDDAVRKVFPLYLGERSAGAPEGIPDLIRLKLKMVTGTVDRIRNLIR